MVEPPLRWVVGEGAEPGPDVAGAPPRQNDAFLSVIESASPLAGVGGRLDQIKEWHDEKCGADGWAITPSGTRGVLNNLRGWRMSRHPGSEPRRIRRRDEMRWPSIARGQGLDRQVRASPQQPSENRDNANPGRDPFPLIETTCPPEYGATRLTVCR
jgi:hypothetical protein